MKYIVAECPLNEEIVQGLLELTDERKNNLLPSETIDLLEKMTQRHLAHSGFDPSLIFDCWLFYILFDQNCILLSTIFRKSYSFKNFNN